jgi:hypothetical protein
MSHYTHDRAVGNFKLGLILSFSSQLIPIAKDGVSPLYTPYIEVCGTVENIDELAGTFSIDAHQYISSLRSNSPTQTSGTSRPNQVFKSIMPVECAFPNTARWTKSGKKLMPQQHRYVSVTGFITGRNTKSVAGSEQTERFTVEVDSIVFLGRPVVMKSSGNSASHGTYYYYITLTLL